MRLKGILAAVLAGAATAVSLAAGAPNEPPFRPLGERRARLRSGNAYSVTMAEEALPVDQLPRLVQGHPRMLLRPRPWKYGLSVDQLRQCVKQEPWAGQLAKDMRKPPTAPGYTTWRALLYLMTGEESLVPMIVERILEAKPAYNCGGALVTVALWYDWIYNSKSVSDPQRKEMADKIAEVGLKCAKIFESGWAFDIWTHRGSPGWASDVLAAGLVLDDDHPAAAKLRSWGMGYFQRNYLRSWHHTGGAWMHGGSSYNVGLIMPQVIACWASAVEKPDLYEVIRSDYGNWLEGHLHYMMCEVLPDKTRSDALAWDYNPPGLRIKGRSSYWAAARACRVPEFFGFQRWLGEDPKGGAYGRLLRALSYGRDVFEGNPKIGLDAPFSKLWGRHGPGYLQMRSKGWAPDSTVIEFKCGDLAWTHAHSNHSNSFWIYHKGRLAVQGGSYGLDRCWHGGHGSHYFTRSISGNTMLIYQPGEFAHAGGPGAEDQEPPGVIAEPGGQRFPFAFGQTCFTFDEYLRRKTEVGGPGFLFEGGDIPAFEHAPDFSWTYVCGDATMAYNNPRYCYEYKGRKNKPKVDLVTRSMAWLANKYLVIFDRVNALDPTYRKAWICHFQGEPKVSGRMIRADVPGHIEDYDGNEVVMTWADGFLKPPDPKDPGRLFVQTFLPEKHTIRRIGGDGYEAGSNGKNRTGDGHKGLKVDSGRWRIEVSPAEPARFDNFLHLLYPTDTRTGKMPPAEMVAAADDRMVGLAVGGWLVMLGRQGEVAGQVAYQAPKGRTEHLVVDLMRGGRYAVSGIPAGAKTLTASAEGTLRFATDAKGPVTLTPKE